MPAIDLTNTQERGLVLNSVTQTIDDLELIIAGLTSLDEFDTANGLVAAVNALQNDDLLIPFGTDRAELVAVIGALDNVLGVLGTITPADLDAIRTFRQKAGLLVSFPVQ